MIAKKSERQSQAMPTIFTIGHSTRTVAEFVALLRQAGIDLLIDVRSVPRSRTNPQFNADALPETLGDAGISYRQLPALGGLRHRTKGAMPSPNTLWRVAAFRNFAAPLCVQKLCGGAATGASSPTICWQQGFR